MALLKDVADIVISGKAKKTPGIVQEALDSGLSPKDILNTMIDAMSVVGERFSRTEIFVPEMLVAAKAMKKGVDVLKPLLLDAGVDSMGKMIMGTVAGDLHDIGKNLVIMMIESAGFEVIDLGVDVPVEKFVSAAAEDGVKIVACSALLTTTMAALEATVAALKAAGKDYKIMVGGAPINQEFADTVGADAYTPDAASAAKKAKELVA